MARRNRADGSVRGPTSALTNFLASLGVEAQLSNGNAEAASSSAAQTPGAGPSTAGPSTAGPSGITTPIAEDEREELDSDDLDDERPAKRQRAASVDSDDLDAEFTPSASASGAGTPALTAVSAARRGPRKAVGEFMNCGECGKQFTVTAYTKEHPQRSRTWLCTACCPKLGIDAFAKPKKNAASAPPAKKERAKIVHYEVTKGAPLLADLCIEVIGKNIEDAEALGDIGSINLDKVCKIICKSRRLTPETATIFYDISRTELVMYDCTSLVHESYVALANLNPNLEKLNLQLCGQLSTDTLIVWSKALKHLKSLELNGPFLARKNGWIEFLKARGENLEELHITQSPRIDLEVIQTMVDSCPNLKSLKLDEIRELDSEFLEPLAKLTKLETLAINSPGNDISDEAVITLLQAIGDNLTTLDLSENPELGDEILPVVAKYCPKLNKLSLRNVEFTDGALQKYFETLASSNRPGFIALDLEKGHDLSSSSLRALTAHSRRTLERLSLVGWRSVEADAVCELASCPHLRYLDIGWCRNVTDFTIKEIIDGCNHISEIRVWGCNQLTDRVPRKPGLKVIGIETHAL